MKRSAFVVTVFVLFAGLVVALEAQESQGVKPSLATDLAPTPPMGWNSYDAFGSSVTESQFRAEVEFLKAHLLACGWEYAVIDYLWFNPAGKHDIALDKEGKLLDTLVTDEFGRLLPTVNRFQV